MSGLTLWRPGGGAAAGSRGATCPNRPAHSSLTSTHAPASLPCVAAAAPARPARTGYSQLLLLLLIWVAVCCCIRKQEPSPLLSAVYWWMTRMLRPTGCRQTPKTRCASSLAGTADQREVSGSFVLQECGGADQTVLLILFDSPCFPFLCSAGIFLQSDQV